MRKTLILISAAGIAAASLSAPALARGEGAAEREPITRAKAEERAAEAFARLDVNRDGVINPADREARFAEHFAKADSDGDGKLSLVEASAAREARHADRGERGEQAGERRRMPRGEARMGRGGMRAMHHRPGNARSADADGDGQVSQAEFSAAALARFDRADADSDGTITRGEGRKGMGMRGGMRPHRMRLRD